MLYTVRVRYTTEVQYVITSDGFCDNLFQQEVIYQELKSQYRQLYLLCIAKKMRDNGFNFARKLGFKVAKKPLN